MVWNLFSFKGDFNLGKGQKLQDAKSGLYRSWLTWMVWCFAKKLCTRCDACHGETANHQLPVAAASESSKVSSQECLCLMQNLIQILPSTCSVILNVMATQYTCSLNSIYCPHWLVQWSHHCSHMCIPAHSPWLPGYIDVSETILVILTMIGLIPERPCTLSIYVYYDTMYSILCIL